MTVPPTTCGHNTFITDKCGMVSARGRQLCGRAARDGWEQLRGLVGWGSTGQQDVAWGGEVSRQLRLGADTDYKL